MVRATDLCRLPTFDAQSHLPLLHSSQGVLDLHQLACLVEGRQGKIHVPHPYVFI